MRRALVVLALALVVTPAAGAKGPIKVCGPAGCAPFAADGMRWMMGLSGAASIPPPSPYYVIKWVGVGEPLGYWIPAAGVVRSVFSGGVGVWSPADDTALRTVVGAVAPFAAPKQVTVHVNDENVRGDATYLRLFTIGKQLTSPPTRVSWLPIWIRGSHTPWTDSFSDLRISRKGNYLYRNGLVFTIPGATAKKIRSLQPLG